MRFAELRPILLGMAGVIAVTSESDSPKPPTAPS